MSTTSWPATTATVPHASTRPTSKAWAHAGVAASVLAIGTVVTTSLIDAVYREEITDDPAAIARVTLDQAPLIHAYHLTTTLAALLLVVFALGLGRRLRQAAPSAAGLAPGIASAGLLLTAGVLILGTALDTEISTGSVDNVQPETFIFFGHWIGTVPWVWVGAGLAGLAVHVAARGGGVPRWAGRVGLVLGGLTTLVGVSPLQYAAVLPGVLWLLITACGFAWGDRR
jgi:hypothetical protein